MHRRDDSRRSNLLREKKANIAQRLKAVCGDLGPEEFDSLVEQIALVDIKYSVRRTEELFDADEGHARFEIRRERWRVDQGSDRSPDTSALDGTPE